VPREHALRMANAGELEQLEYLALVAKVCNELENHLGMSDKVLGMRALPAPQGSAWCHTLG
jgi:hypothetical protein